MNILTYPHPLLAMKLDPVVEFGRDLSELICTMTDTMHDHNGVGLAANQVGVNQRVLVWFDGYLVNPVITSQSGSVLSIEGCLSLPSQFIKVRRSAQVSIHSFDRTGQTTSLNATGTTAIILQHELDHLNGLTMLDRAKR